jgi:acetyl esterase/lipase
LEYAGRAILGSLPQEDRQTNAWFSPASLMIPNPSGLFKGFPPTWILAGGVEVGVDMMRTLRDRLVCDIGEGEGGVKYVEYPDAIHDFLIFNWHEPERTEALKELRMWVVNCLQ